MRAPDTSLVGSLGRTVGRAVDFARLTVERRVPESLTDRIDLLKAELQGRPTDDFGWDPEALKPVAPLLYWMYREYFRVHATGLDELPRGRVLFVANHSGQVPLDGMMIGCALLFEAQPPRAVRSMVERWVPTLPFVSTFFSRLGQVLGTPENCRTLLDQEHPILVFPEGVRGINKTYDKAYELQAFGHGFMRLALETRTPIVPVGVVGAEEQYPALWNAKPLARALGVPAIPITPLFPLLGPLGLLPLPVKYHIAFGRPMWFEGDPNDEDQGLSDKVAVVREAIDALLQAGLESREHVFW